MTTTPSRCVASFIKDVSANFRGNAALYRLTPPFRILSKPRIRYEYVVVSAVVAPFSGPETYIFASDPEGKVKNWGELEGSYRGGLDHAEALCGMGYEIEKAVTSSTGKP